MTDAERRAEDVKALARCVELCDRILAVAGDDLTARIRVWKLKEDLQDLLDDIVTPFA